MTNKASESAEAFFKEGYNCAQSVLMALAPQYGLPTEAAVKVAQAFGGGIARTGNTCGAVTGALMAIGLVRSAASGADAQAKKDSYLLAQEFFARFKAIHGSIVCRDLLGCDMGTEDGFKKAHDQGLTKTVCPKFVKDAVEIMTEVLAVSEPK